MIVMNTDKQKPLENVPGKQPENAPEEKKVFHGSLDLEQAAAELCLELETVREFILSFLEDGEKEYLVPIDNALQTMAFIEVKKEAHRLKGAALNLRLAGIGNFAQKLESAADREDAEECLYLYNALEKEFLGTKNAL